KKRPSGAFSPFPRRGAPKLQSSAERTPQRPSGSSHASGRGGWVPKPHGGATTPKALFFGAPPRFFGQDQRNGVEQAAQRKDNAGQNGEFLPPEIHIPPDGEKPRSCMTRLARAGQLTLCLRFTSFCGQICLQTRGRS